jgi:DNA-binding NarL/FixJ family response regulator
MPVLDGLGATRVLRTEMPGLRVVILTVSDDEQDLFEAVKSGALGYLLKDLEAEAFFDAIEAIGRGESVIPPRLARGLWTEFTRVASPDVPAETETEPLTEREQEVLALVASGHTNREIAEQLTVSENTVKFHMRGILDKLHLRNRTEVARWVSEQRHATRRDSRFPPESETRQ